MTTRWRMPPERLCGYWPRRFRGSGIPTHPSSSSALADAWALVNGRCRRSVSVSWCPMVRTGVSDVIGSWNTMAMREPHSDFASPRVSVATSRPSTSTRDPGRTMAFGGRMFITALDRTDLPEPDSPTIPSVRPGFTSRVTPSTARTGPRGVSNHTRRSATDSAGGSVVTSAVSDCSGRTAVFTARTPVRLDLAPSLL